MFFPPSSSGRESIHLLVENTWILFDLNPSLETRNEHVLAPRSPSYYTASQVFSPRFSRILFPSRRLRSSIRYTVLLSATDSLFVSRGGSLSSALRETLTGNEASVRDIFTRAVTFIRRSISSSFLSMIFLISYDFFHLFDKYYSEWYIEK